MAIEKNIVIGADLSGLETKLGELIDLLKTSQEQANKTSDQLDEINTKVDGIGKNSKSSTKSVGGLAKGFKGMGIAIKAAGIGLLLSAMGILKDLFDNNQKVVDAFSTSFNVLAGVFSEVSKVLEGVYNNVSKSSENFDALSRVLENMLTIAVTPLLLSFQAIKGALLGAQLAWEQSFLGGKDPLVIAELEEKLAAVGDKMLDIGSEAIDAGKNIVEDFGEAITEVGAIGTQVLDGFKDIDMEGIYTNAKAMTELNKAAELAEVRAQGLIEKYDLQAEKLRQVRDDERLSIDERVKANEELLKVLEEQEKVMLENAEITLAKANQELALAPDNIEFIKAKMAAENELAGVQAQVAGFRSEQLMNEMALQRELLDIERARGETEIELFEMRSQARTEDMANERKRIQQEMMDIGTIAFLKKDALREELENTEEGTARYEEILNERKIIDQEYLNNVADLKRQERELDKATAEAGLQMASDAIGVLMSFNDNYDEEDEAASKKAFERNKKMQMGQAVISTAQGIMSQLAVPQDALTGQNFAKAALVAATGVAQIAKIRSTEFEFSGGADTSTSGLSAPSTSPSFNLVGSTGTNALLQSLQNNPMKAYVVGSDVTSQQQLDRNRINQVSFP
jgi:hypothetical protein